MFLLGILALIVGLIISVALHELGHLMPAKKFGALVPEYWVGFGPTLYQRRVGGTTYGIKAILLGGYVRILGMFPPGKTAGHRRTLVEEARLQSAEELAAARRQGLTGTPFYQLGTGQKLIIMLGGPVMNLLLSFILTGIVVTGIGWQQPTTTVSDVVSTTTELGLTGDSAPTPASSAGLQAGDQIVAWDGHPVEDWSQLQTLMETAPSQVTVDRAGQRLELDITPLATDQGPKIGIFPELERVHGTVGQAASAATGLLTGTVQALVTLPANLWELTTELATDAPRDPAGAVSVVGVARLAGEVSTVSSGLERVSMLLSLLASLNMALFVFNLIPLPPLDGGHVAGALWGGVRNLWARLRRQPRPAPVDTAKMVPLSYGVFLVLIVMSLILMAADIIKPLELF
ncbi:M50 family metallopeptidase [Scrofimicrobium sp. R131]|uniref:M50 family metallopeptidase n=1 Tax=Scrofimicrobium appendicitidis TaxID=3079930 RepID=A0AAU7V912_9ACTO